MIGKADAQPFTTARIALLALILAAFALRIYRLEYQSIWTDEGFSVDFASQSLGQMLGMWGMQQRVVENVAASTVPGSELGSAADIHAPLYYFLLHFWIDLTGRTEFALRFLSTILGLLIVPLLYATGKRLFDERVGLLAALFGVLSPFYVAYSQEARMYALSATLSLLSAYLMIRIVGRSANLPHLAAFVIATALGLYTHYFFALIVIFQNVFVFGFVLVQTFKPVIQVSSGLKSIRNISLWRLTIEWSLAQAAILLLLAPWLETIVRQGRTYANEALSVPPATLVLYRFWQAVAVGLSVNPNTLAVYMVAALSITATALSVGWIADRSSRPQLLLLLLYVAIPLAGALLVLQYRPMFHPRYLIAISPAYYLLLAASLRGFRNFVSWLPYMASIAPIALLVAGLNSYYFDENFRKDDARAVALFLEQKASSDDLVVLDSPEPLGYYYRGAAPWAFIPGEPEVAVEALNRLGAERKNIYHVKWWQSNTDPYGLVSYLLAKYGMQTDAKQFAGYQVDKYRMREGLDRFVVASDMRDVGGDFDRTLQLNGASYGIAYSGTSLPGDDKLGQNGKLWVVLRWRLLQETPIEYRTFVYLRDAKGHVVGQADRTLRKGQLSTRHWGRGDTSETYHILSLLPGTPPGAYQLDVGVYDAATQRRLSVLNPALIPIGTTLKLGEIQVIRGPAVAPAQDGLSDDKLAISQLAKVDFGSLRLLGYDLPNRKLKAGDSFPLTLLWQALGDIDRDYALELEAEGPEGRSHSWQARKPNYGAYPTIGWVSGELVRDWHDFLLPANMTAGEYRLVGRVVEMPQGATVGTVDLGAMYVEDRPRSKQIPQMSNRLSVRFGGKVELLGFDLRPQDGMRAGETMELVLYWRGLREMEESYTVFAHLLDSRNLIWAQDDSLPAGGERPTTSWAADEVVVDRHMLKIKEDALPGQYTIEAGLYEAASGKRLEAEADGVDLMNDAALIAGVILQR